MTLLAIYAVALHVILLGLAPFTGTTSAVDPFLIICHSVTGSPGDEAPVKSGLVPGHACEHCNLCSVTAPPPAPDVVLAVNLDPVQILHVLRLASAASRIGLTSDPKLARGPPTTV